MQTLENVNQPLSGYSVSQNAAELRSERSPNIHGGVSRVVEQDNLSR